MKTKTFDCVQMKREGAERVRQFLASMSPEECRHFWEQLYQRMIQKQAQLQQQKAQQ